MMPQENTMPSADIAMDGVYEENAGAIFFLLAPHHSPSLAN